jgi:hypothetical protein
MAETATTAAKPQTLDDVMIAMDVVDTLRHREDLVRRELSEGDREAELIARLRKIYLDQGIEVPDRVLADGVKALKESRFVYTPPPRSWKRTLFTLWAKREAYATGAAMLGFVLVWVFAGYYFLISRPAQLAEEQARIELSETLPRALQRGHADAVAVATDEVAKQKADTLLAEGKQAIDHGDRVAASRVNTELAVLRDKLVADAALTKALQQAHADVVAVATEADAKLKAAALLSDGQRAVRDGDKEEVQRINSALDTLREDLTREYILTIVSRPGEKTGVWRRPPRNNETRNYYLIVEAIAPDGSKLRLPIRNEENGTTETVTKFGVRVPREVYEAVAKDKRDDGIVQRNRFGVKRRGKLAIDYQMPFEGGYITRW